HARLARRGLTLSAGLVAWGIAQEASAAVPPDLAAATAHAIGRGAASPRVAALAARTARALLWEKVRGTVAVLLGLGLLAAGLGLAERLGAATPVDGAAAAPPVALAAQAAEKPKEIGRAAG